VILIRKTKETLFSSAGFVNVQGDVKGKPGEKLNTVTRDKNIRSCVSKAGRETACRYAPVRKER